MILDFKKMWPTAVASLVAFSRILSANDLEIRENESPAEMSNSQSTAEQSASPTVAEVTDSQNTAEQNDSQSVAELQNNQSTVDLSTTQSIAELRDNENSSYMENENTVEVKNNQCVVVRAGEGPCPQLCPDAYPKSECNVWNLNAAFLYWRANEDGLGVAIEMSYDNLDNPVRLDDAKVINQHYHWDVGGRFGIGYTFEHDGWDIEFAWTTFHNTASRSLDASEDTCSEEGVLIPTYSAMPSPCNPCASPATCDSIHATAFNVGPQPTLTIHSVDSHWKLELEYADLELGREFLICNNFEMRPFFGLRGIWIDQSLHIEYRGGSVDDLAPVFFAATPCTSVSAVDKVHLYNNFKGIGARAGLSGQWDIEVCCWDLGLSIFGDFALAMVYGRGSDSYHEWMEASDEGFAGRRIAKLKDTSHDSKFMTDLQLGIRYQVYFGCKYTKRFTLSAGWEHHGFFNLNKFYRLQHINDGGGQYSGNDGSILNGNEGEYVVIREHGDLTTQGATISARFDF